MSIGRDRRLYDRRHLRHEYDELRQMLGDYRSNDVIFQLPW